MEITEDQLTIRKGSTIVKEHFTDDGMNSTNSEKVCNGCKMEISGKLVLKVADHFWHEECMSCHDCGERLEQKCFSRYEMVFCYKDFHRRFGPKCHGCNDSISPTQIVRKISDRVYHISCLCCITCNKQLATGDKFFLLEDGRVICKDDYMEKDQAVDPSQEKTKRARTFISTSQLSSLKLIYCATPKPALHERERISKETGLDMRVVQVWFQNRRAKDRRILNKGQFPWLQTANRRARHMRSQSWSPRVSRFSGITEEEELDDLIDLHCIKKEVSNQAMNSLLRSNKILMPSYQPDSIARFTDDTLDIQPHNPTSSPTVITDQRMSVDSPCMAGGGLVGQVHLDYTSNLQNGIDGSATDNRMFMKEMPSGNFSQNLSFWPDLIDHGMNYPTNDMTVQDNTSHITRQPLDNRMQQAQKVKDIARNFNNSSHA